MVLKEAFVVVAGGLIISAPLALLGSRLAGALAPDAALPVTRALVIGPVMVLFRSA
jgi:hypothetical protein